MSTRSVSSRQRQCWLLLLALCLLACAASASIENPSLETTVARRLDDEANGDPSVTPEANKQLGENPDDGGEDGDGEKGSGDGGNSGKLSNETINKPGVGDTEQVDVCAQAGTSCQACSDATKTFVDDEYACAYRIDQEGGTSDILLCQKVKKSEIVDGEGDCGGTDKEDKKTAAPGEPTENNKPSAQPEEEKGGAGGSMFLIMGLVVVVGGGLYVAKSKMGAKGPQGFSAVKHGKYETVAAADAELETDDWDDWGEGGDGDVEMQPSVRDDHSLTRRASGDKSFQDDDDYGWGGSTSTSTSTPQIVPKRSPRATTPKWQDTEGRSSPPVSNPPFSAGRLPTAPRSAPTGLGLSDSIPQRVTSLGEKIQKPPPKKAAPRQEDDIFASMGLSSKPKFTPATKPTASPRSVPSPFATGGSRWAQTTATMGATTATNFGAAELKTTASMDDDDGNWDDDGDLDDLLDD